MEALALLTDAIKYQTDISASDAGVFLDDVASDFRAYHEMNRMKIVIDEAAMHSIHMAQSHRSGRFANSKRFIKHIVDCAASLSIFGSKKTFIGKLMTLPKSVLVKMGFGVLKSTMCGIARVNMYHALIVLKTAIGAGSFSVSTSHLPTLI